MVPSAAARRVRVQFWPPQAPVEPTPGPSTCSAYVRPSHTSVASTRPAVTTTSTVRRTPQLLHATAGGPWVVQDDDAPVAPPGSAVAQSGSSAAETGDEAYEGIATTVEAISA